MFKQKMHIYVTFENKMKHWIGGQYNTVLHDELAVKPNPRANTSML